MPLSSLLRCRGRPRPLYEPCPPPEIPAALCLPSCRPLPGNRALSPASRSPCQGTGPRTAPGCPLPVCPCLCEKSFCRSTAVPKCRLCLPSSLCPPGAERFVGSRGPGRGLARHPPSPRPSALPPTWFLFPLTTSGWGISEASSSSSVTPPPTHTHSLSHSLTHTSTPLMDKQKPVALVSAHSQPPLSPRTSASGFFFQSRSLGATSGLPVAGCPHCASESSVRLENTFICPGDNLRNAVLGAAQATWMLSRAEAL